MADPQGNPNKPISRREDATAVVLRLREAGHVAYFAGGCVRDMLLGLEPKDWDVATDAPPKRVQELFPRTQAVGAAFGVILVRQGPSQIEVATFRWDQEYHDGRRPSGVVFTTAEQDAQRRDFTINGLFFDPLSNQTIDFVGGQEDLKRRLIRAIGHPEARFQEDHLRMLRAVRFASRFNFQIEPKTEGAIRLFAPQLARISPERIAEELRLMLTATTREKAWEWLWKLELMQVIFRELPEKSVTYWAGHGTFPVFPYLAPNEPVMFGLALAALTYCYRSSSSAIDTVTGPLLSRGEALRTVRACRSCLKISNEDSDLLLGCLNLEEVLSDDPPTRAILCRFLAQPFSTDARKFLGALRRANRVSSRSQWLEEQFQELEKTNFAPPPLLTGDDLTAAGLKPGKAFKIILDRVYDEQLEGRIDSKPAALSLGLRLADELK